MKYLRLVVKSVGRNKRRTVLTILSITVSIFLLATMRSVITTLNAASEVSGAETRLVVRRNTSLADDMPEAYREKIAQVPGVILVCPVDWFGGIYKEDKLENFFAQFHVDANILFDVLGEYQIDADQLAAFKRERAAAVAGRKLFEKFGWKIGDVIELKGTIYPVNPRLTLRGMFTGPQEEALYFHREYVEEALGRPGRVGTFTLKIDSPDSAPRIMETIDRMFANSAAPTKTETEAAFQASFVSMLGNIKGLISGIGMVVIFTITIIAANTMAMATRERVTEVAVMKALGFKPGLILVLILAESILISLIGGIVGSLGARTIFRFTGASMGGFLANFSVTTGTVVLCLGVSLLIGFLSGGIPAWSAARVRIVDGLRQVA